MAETVFADHAPAPPAVAEPRPIVVSPDLVDGAIAVGGAALFAVAGVLLGFYLMLPFNLG